MLCFQLVQWAKTCINDNSMELLCLPVGLLSNFAQHEAADAATLLGWCTCIAAGGFRAKTCPEPTRVFMGLTVQSDI